MPGSGRAVLDTHEHERASMHTQKCKYYVQMDKVLALFYTCGGHDVPDKLVPTPEVIRQSY